jgi:hypothetical protein
MASKSLEKVQPRSPGTIVYKGRDYIAGQPGFMTFLEDGFGTETLAFCHDLVEFPNDRRSQVKVARPLWSQISDHLAQVFDVSLQTASSVYLAVERWLKSSWTYHWKQGEEEDVDSMDWLVQS